MNALNINTTVKMGFMGLATAEPMYELFVARSTDLHEVMTEDGMGTDVNACVGLRRVDGKEWHHARLFTGGFQCVGDDEVGYHDIYVSAAAQAEDLIEKIKARGTIDLGHWDEV
ncbi:hypothetical protein [Salmonella phage PMBT28]|nr:hypothetical protein [Salmonella phage PMBT28]